MSKSLFIVDSRVTDYQALIEGLSDPMDVLIIDSGSDGLSQIAAHLRGQTGYDALHIVSHGSEGALYLGNGVIDTTSLASYQNQLTDIGGALTDSGDILLYGCDVARDTLGQAFIGQIAQVTGADVAASSDLTGASSLGGDWVLEISTGSIEEAIIPGQMNGLLDLGPKPSPTGYHQLGWQTQTLENPMHSMEVGMLFATLVYGDNDLLANLPEGSDISTYSLTKDNGFNDNYKLFFSHNPQLDEHWTVLTAEDITLPTAPNIIAGFTDGGLYHSYVHTLLSNDQKTGAYGNSNAILVKSTDSHTLVLAFRGTDKDDEAFTSGQTFTGDGAYRHYEAFRPLVEAAYSYANDPGNGIEHIVVAGHSPPASE